ncbi:transcriptional coactivator/pterin dehydratase [Xylaria intraflava]|nr:transcriptional coactivator/pterin dehydratase [Xylaria intraflava]
MFLRHASPPLRCTGALVSRAKKPIATLHVTRSVASALLPSTLACTQLRGFRQSSLRTSAMGSTAAVKFSAGADELSLNAALQELLSSAGKGGRWSLIPNGQGLERSFKFKNFAKTWDFMTAVSLQCKLKNHHPEWSNVYNATYIRWTTHSPEGLSAKDTELARLCDALARDFGEVVDDADAAGSSTLRQVADRVVADASDCCTPKQK